MREPTERDVRNLFTAFTAFWLAAGIGFSLWTAHRFGPLASPRWVLGAALGTVVVVGLMVSTARPVTYLIGYCYVSVKKVWRHRRR